MRASAPTRSCWRTSLTARPRSAAQRASCARPNPSGQRGARSVRAAASGGLALVAQLAPMLVDEDLLGLLEARRRARLERSAVVGNHWEVEVAPVVLVLVGLPTGVDLVPGQPLEVRLEDQVGGL